MSWATTDVGPRDLESEAGLFTLTGRADYGVTDNVTLSGFATWKRDVHLEVDGVAAADSENWAEFGGGVRVLLTEDIGVRAGYSFEALHPNFERHKFMVRLELGF